MESSVALVWFRNDLRLADNEALDAALRSHSHVVALYVHAPEEEGIWEIGSASKWWLHHSLAALDKSLASIGNRLIVCLGPTASAIKRIAKESSATAVYFNKRYEPWAQEQERQVILSLSKIHLKVHVSRGNLLFDPEQVRTKDGNPYKVFTPFWKTLLEATEPAQPLIIPKSIPSPQTTTQGLELEELGLLPTKNWANGIAESWTPGESGAQASLREFLLHSLDKYPSGRDRPDQSSVSRMSPHLHFGELSARTIWHAVKNHSLSTPQSGAAAECYLRELAWREFAYHLLFHYPQTTAEPLRQEFKSFPWSKDNGLLSAWKEGKTGYPIVDAGMRELWHTGWMHNRVRMIVASFLVKDLLISWQRGAQWFWDTLVDADMANNTLGWQWAAGCGADAAPYFRIFNPTLQGEKFDPDGLYVSRWVPELAKLPRTWIHRPWLAPPDVLAKASIELGKTYPHPLVDHAIARKRALAAFESIRAVHYSRE